MKKIILLSIIFSYPFFSQAQLSGGIKAGLNVANVSIEPDVISTDNRVGLHLGGYAKFDINENISLQPELLYSQKGFGFTLLTASSDMNINYMDLAALVRYNINEMISIHAGPQLGFVLSAKAKEDDGEDDFKDIVKSTDFSLAGGVQVDLPTGIIGGVRYNLGITNISETSDDPDELELGSSIKNGVLQFYVGYKLFNN